MIHATDTICAPATSAGMGAIAVIRVSGPDALAAVDRVVAFRSGTAAAAKGYTANCCPRLLTSLPMLPPP